MSVAVTIQKLLVFPFTRIKFLNWLYQKTLLKNLECQEFYKTDFDCGVKGALCSLIFVFLYKLLISLGSSSPYSKDHEQDEYEKSEVKISKI